MATSTEKSVSLTVAYIPGRPTIQIDSLIFLLVLTLWPNHFGPSGHEQTNVLDPPGRNRCVIRDSISADVLKQEIKRLMSLEEGNDDETKNMVSMMTGVASIDAKMSSPDAITAFFEFEPRWTRYLNDNPEIARKLDPVYVVAHIVPGDVLPVFPAVAPGSPIELAPLNESAYAWVFPDKNTAAYWCGTVRADNPDLRLWMFTCPNPCMYW